MGAEPISRESLGALIGCRSHFTYSTNTLTQTLAFILEPVNHQEADCEKEHRQPLMVDQDNLYLEVLSKRVRQRLSRNLEGPSRGFRRNQS
jgi:hypothetical protein